MHFCSGGAFGAADKKKKAMEKDSKIRPSGSWVPTIDGLRALSCLSLVLLHTEMIAPATKHPDDPVFKAYRQHPISGIHKFLGCQVLSSLLHSPFLLLHPLKL